MAPAEPLPAAPTRPATTSQLEIWLAAEREPEGGRWVIPVDLEFAGPVDVPALRAAVADVLARHPQLRTSFRTEDGELVQVPTDAPVRFRTHPRPEPYDRAAALRAAAGLAARPLPLDAGPLLRADLLAHPDGALLALAVHHIVADGWSVDVLCRHLVEAYGARLAGQAPAAAAPPAEPAEVDPAEAADAAEHWSAVLDGEPPTLAPLPDLVRDDAAPGRPRHVVADLDPATVAALRALTRREQASPAVVLLAAWCLLLHAHSGLDDGVVGMPFGGRLDEATHEEVGLFTRLLPVRSGLHAEQPFAELVGELREQVITSLGATELAGALPVARVVFAHYGTGQTEWAVGGTAVRRLTHPTETAKQDLGLAATESPGRIELRVDYDSAVYGDGTARLLLDQLGALLAAAAADPDRGCRALLSSLAAPAHPVPDPPAPAVALSDLVLRRAAADPGALAVRDGDRELTYGELVARAAGLAHWLRAAGAGRGDVVALLLPAGADTVVAMLAVALAGAAYLPLDPAYPDAQLRVVVADAAPRLVLTDAAGAGRAGGVAEHRLDEALAAAGTAAEPPGDGPRPADPLDILYTSGSTGRPKGVVLPHGGMARLMDRPDFLPLGPGDVVSHLSPLNFDGATYEIWGALTHGAALVVLPKELVLDPAALRDAIRRHGVSTLLVTTPLLNRLIEDAPDALQSIDRVYFGGELISVPHVRRALAWAGPGTLLHSYGPTENSFTSTWWRIDEAAEAARTLPIGRPVPGTTAYVVFEGTLDLAPAGAPGELLLGGTGVSYGYLGDPARTARSFVPDPFGPALGGRLYRTGDRVRWTADGLLEFIGRGDNQVKIRSQRVELGEVEAALRTHPAVDSAFVTARPDARGDKEIVGYVVPAAGAGADWADGVRSHLRRLLPDFAVPTHLVGLPELPVNANGKIDRRRLPEPVAVAAGPAVRARTRPRPAAGATAGVRAAWADVLGHDGFTDDANFFDVGGHSLLLVRLQAALRRHAGHAPTIADLLRHTSVRAQHALAGGRAASEAAAAVRPDGTADGDGAIAVVGMACRFAGADDLYEFWDNLAAGRDRMAVGPGPLLTDYPDGARRVARYGALRDPYAFDAGLFGFTGEAAAVDPQYGVMFEVMWAAVENAALRMADIAESTSVYVGAPRVPRRDPRDGADRPVRADDVVGSDPTFLPTRFSYWHDLRGESLLLDTACSTSLVAAHLACQSLRSGRSDYALAGGVSVFAPADGSYLHVPGQIYAADGYCRPLDRRASGTVPGDGAGCVLLRRLEDAVRDGDPVYAVIRGSAINNDGRPRVGYSAPSVDGQARVIRQALANAGVTGADLDYVEPHGTGTRLGDAIEAIALTEAYGPDGPPVAVGGLKASIGHTNTAAGVAGLIKTVLALHHGWLPATPHVGEPIDELARFGDRFGLLAEGRPWPDRGRPRRAGISSFGVGGTNAHVVVEAVRS